MKHFLLRAFVSANIKNGIGFAYQVCMLVANALQGVLSGDGLSDERRKQLSSIMRGILAVRDFLGRLAEIMNAPLQSISQYDLVDKATKLDRITDSL